MRIILPNLAWAAAAAVAMLAQPQAGAWAQASSIPTGSAQVPPSGPHTAAPAGFAAPAADPAAGDLLVQQAVEAMQRHETFAARLRQRIDLFGHRLVGSGQYLQQGQGPDRRLRLELRLHVAEQPIVLQQVCDGQFLWTLNQLDPAPVLQRVDARRVRQALEEGGRAVPYGLANTLALGGLPKLLEQLRQNFQFGPAIPGHFDGTPVWVLVGQWRAERIAALVPEQQAAVAAGGTIDLDGLPPQLPHEVLLALGQHDLAPYQIEFRRRAGEGSAAGQGSDARVPIFTLELFDLKIDAPLDPRAFVYQPSGLDVLDTTDSLLKSLGVGSPAESTNR
jgi:hypothetical protein